MQFLSITCAIYLLHFEEKVSFQVKITLKTGGRVIITSALCKIQHSEIIFMTVTGVVDHFLIK